ncbi:MAG: hypothetical protein QM534_15365 [Sediminibacterium sp.]|nr:hypothetical protein [Sediminibacterium sp.]
MKKSILTITMLGFLLSECRPPQKETIISSEAEAKRISDSIAQAISEAMKVANAEALNEQSQMSYNYEGYIDKYKIKAQLVFGEATNAERSGALQIPVSGYYFYESKKIKIPLEGSSNGLGIIYLVAHTEGGEELFDGSYDDAAMTENFSGTWNKNGKELKFYLVERSKK